MPLHGTSKIYHGGGIGGGNGYQSGGAAPVTSYYVIDGASEAESITTNAVFQQKLLVSFAATLGVRYKIEGYCELGAAADEDAEAELTINTVQYCFAHYKNLPYATRYCQFEGCFYISNALTGNQDIRLNWRNGYGAGDKYIRRARILVTKLF